MDRSPRSTSGPDRFPADRGSSVVTVRGRAAVAAYLRAHLYGAAVGRTVLDRCISAVAPADRPLLEPLRGQFDDEIATARQLLVGITPIGAPGRRLVRMSSAVALAALPAGPLWRDPLTRLGLLETLRTVVVAKRAMWELLADSWVADGVSGGGVSGSGNRKQFAALASQARDQEEVLEALRRSYGSQVFG